jgi:transposase
MIHGSRDRDEVRRATAILNLMEGASVGETSERLAAARSSIYRWLARYAEGGIEALRSARRGREQTTVTDELIKAVKALLEDTPRKHGYLRSTWSSELLSRALQRLHGLEAHASTLRRLLAKLGFGWRRARPTLHIRDPKKAERMAAIDAALADRTPRTEVFYVDEVDIDLNPRIGFMWQRRGRQQAIPTPGQNRKHYLAGALHAHTGRVLWQGHERKNSTLFIDLLRLLKATYRRARRIVLIVDNYIIHKSRQTRRWLTANPKFELLFQPAYHPWVNRIERLWKQLHETVTRNHRHTSMNALLSDVERFLTVAQPFPGNYHGVAHFGSAI